MEPCTGGIVPRRHLTHIAALLTVSLIIGWCSAMPFGAQSAQPFRPNAMDTVLYGAAYYPEYMPYDRLDRDVDLMQKAGISVVRVGESSWGLWEPEDGKFEFAWMDSAVEKLHAAGIRVIMGTPTYSIPAWLYKEHPEVMVRKPGGESMYYGIRQNMDTLNPTYRFYCERVIRKIAGHYRNNPAIIGYQIDNETTSYGASNHDVQAGFEEYLKVKFKSVEELNKAWGLNYWGQRLNDWTELPPIDGIINPGWKLEAALFTVAHHRFSGLAGGDRERVQAARPVRYP